MSKAKIRYVASCLIHGKESVLWAGRQVLVPKFQNKREKMLGCPICKSEFLKEKLFESSCTT